jgi:hypothetical protein
MGADDSANCSEPGFKNGWPQQGSQHPKHSQNSARKRHVNIINITSNNKNTKKNTIKKGAKKMISTQLLRNKMGINK